MTFSLRALRIFENSNIRQSLLLEAKEKPVSILCPLQGISLRGKRNKAPGGWGWISISAKKPPLSPRRWLKVWPTRSASLPSMLLASLSPVCPPSLLFHWVSQERCVFVMKIIATGCDCCLLTSNWTRPRSFLDWCQSKKLEMVRDNCLRNYKQCDRVECLHNAGLEFVTGIPKTAVGGSVAPPHWKHSWACWHMTTLLWPFESISQHLSTGTITKTNWDLFNQAHLKASLFALQSHFECYLWTKKVNSVKAKKEIRCLCHFMGDKCNFQ